MISFAQNFEDVILSRIFRDRLSGCYVDVGAHLPIIDSVTEHFYRLGWRGVNIEPLEAAYSELIKTRSGDTNIRCAIAGEDGSAKFFALDGFSTLDHDVAAAHRAEGRPSGEINIDTLTLSTVLDRCAPKQIDFLKVDVEGAEGVVLRSNDWTRFRPSLVVVEAVHPVTRVPSHGEWESILEDARYKFVYFDGLNRFYWDSDLPSPDANCFLPPNVFDNFTPYAQFAAETRAAEAARLAQYDRQHLSEVESGAARQAEEEVERLALIDAAMQRLVQGVCEPAPHEMLKGGWQAIIDGRSLTARTLLTKVNDALLQLAQSYHEPPPDVGLETGWRAIVEARQAVEADCASAQRNLLANVDAGLSRLAAGQEVALPHRGLEDGWRAVQDARRVIVEANQSLEAEQWRKVDAALHRFAQGESTPSPHDRLATGWKSLADARNATRRAISEAAAELAATNSAVADQRILLQLSEQRRLALLEARGVHQSESVPQDRHASTKAVPPALHSRHVDSDARLHATRHDLLRSLPISTGGVIAEVGVALGDFSAFLLELLGPEKFVAFDTFDMHNFPEHWGTPSARLFRGLTHEEFYRHRVSAFESSVAVEVGDSRLTLAAYPDEYFDMIYVDAGHTYEHVREDAELAWKKAKNGGVLVFNDYIMYDHHTESVYGVVQAVNELIIEHELSVIGFGLQQSMFCDLAVRK